MNSLPSFLLVTHLVGLALGVGSATVKLSLLLKSRANPALVPSFLKVTKPITQLIVLGLILLTASGVGWLLLGHAITKVLAFKLVLVVALWLLGPLIDKVLEPKFRTLAPVSGESASPAFLRAQRQYLAAEVSATALFYIIVVIWVVF